MNDKDPQTVVIIGGGITGLSTAFYIEKQAKLRGLSIRCLLVEAGAQLGGKIQTELTNGFVIEKGPDSFLARKTAVLDLIEELGITSDLVGTNLKAKKTYILHRNQLQRIPQGLNIGVPTQFLPFAKTGLLSWRGKLRAGLDVLLPKGRHGDQSLGDFLEYRLGKEVVDSMAEPLLAGIYAGDIHKLSLRSTFPQFEIIEQTYGSLIRGMIAQAREKRQSNQTPQPVLGVASPRLPASVFLTLSGGLVQLVKKTADALVSTTVLTGTRIQRVTPDAGNYQIELSTGESVSAKAVVATTPAYETAKLLPLTEQASGILSQIPYVSVATIVLAFRKDQIHQVLDGSGFVVPRYEGRSITACTWTSSKWLHTAPDDKVLIRCYVGRADDQEIVNRSDEELVQLVRKDLADIMNIEAEPLFHRVTRWKTAMPQYTVGHLDRIEMLDQLLSKHPGLFCGGAGMRGLGIPDCIAQGKKLAEQTVDFLTK